MMQGLFDELRQDVAAKVPQKDIDRIVHQSLNLSTPKSAMQDFAAMFQSEADAEQAMADGNAEFMAEHDAEFDRIGG